MIPAATVPHTESHDGADLSDEDDSELDSVVIVTEAVVPEPAVVKTSHSVDTDNVAYMDTDSSSTPQDTETLVKEVVETDHGPLVEEADVLSSIDSLSESIAGFDIPPVPTPRRSTKESTSTPAAETDRVPSMEAADTLPSTDSLPESVVDAPPVPVPRRSTRERHPPRWMRRADFAMQHSMELQGRVEMLTSMVAKNAFNHMPVNVITDVIQIVMQL